MQKIQVVDLGLIKYDDALQVQTEKFNQLIQNKMEGRSNDDLHTLFLCEHEPVITLGKAAKHENLLFAEDFLRDKNIQVEHINRGGDITFHGPGQIVGYPVLDLDLFTTDLKKYMRLLEEVHIQTLAAYGLEGFRIEEETGVWVNSSTEGRPNKICAFGVKTSRWITMHGFALNVNVDLNYFNYIVPCGITDKGVTSLQQELGREVDMNEVKRLLIDNFADRFGTF